MKDSRCLFTAILVILIAACSGKALRDIPVQTQIAPDCPKGVAPYELTWAARDEFPIPQVTFENLAGWTLQADGDANVTLSASTEERIWRKSVAKFTYSWGSAARQGGSVSDKTTARSTGETKAASSTTAFIKPPKPILIKDSFDSVGMWVYGGYYRRSESFDNNPLRVIINLLDSSGRKFSVDLNTIISAAWNIETGVLTKDELKQVQWPMSFESIEIRECDLAGTSEIFLESLSFWTKRRDPSTHSLKPEDFAYLTSRDGMLPTPPPGVHTSVSSTETGAVFQSVHGDSTIEYQVDPVKGFLNGVTAKFNSKLIKPAQDGAIRLGKHGSRHLNVIDKAQVISRALNGDVYTVEWKYDNHGTTITWKAHYQIKGMTLVVDVNCESDLAGGISFGAVSGLDGGRQIFVPYLLINRISHIYTDGPYVAAGNGMFVSVWPDCFNSDFSCVCRK